jgi:hypothetical protein
MEETMRLNPERAMYALAIGCFTAALAAVLAPYSAKAGCAWVPQAGAICDRNLRVRVLPPDARVIQLGGVDGVRHEDVSAADRDAWAARCEPLLVPGEGLYAPGRWTYAAPGCERGPRHGDAGR